MWDNLYGDMKNFKNRWYHKINTHMCAHTYTHVHTHTNTSRDNQGMWIWRCIPMFTNTKVRFTMISWRTHKCDKRFTFFSLSLIHKGGSQSLVVGLQVTYKTTQSYPKHKNTEKLETSRNASTPMVSHKPKSNNYFQELKGVTIYLGGIVYQISSLDSKKEFWTWIFFLILVNTTPWEKKRLL
jgi:hypothetical protein